MRPHLFSIVFTIIILLEVSMPTLAQLSRLDSLTQKISTISGNHKGNLLIDIGNLLPDSTASTYYDEALLHLTDTALIARAIHNKMGSLARLGNYEEAIAVGFPWLQVLEGSEAVSDQTGMSTGYYLSGIYSILAKSNAFAGKFSPAFNYGYKNLRLAALNKDSMEIGRASLDLGFCYYKIKDYSKALDLFLSATEMSFGDYAVTFLSKMNSSLCFAELDSLGLAISYANDAINIAGHRDNRLLHAEFAMGYAYLKSQEFEIARTFFSSSLSRSITLADWRMQADNHLHLSKSFIRTCDLDSAFNHLRLAETIAKSRGLDEVLLEIYRVQMELTLHRGDFDDLVRYQDYYVALKLHLCNAELAKMLAKVEAGWLEKRHEDTIAFQKFKLHEHSKALFYTKWLIIVIVLMLGFIVIIIVLHWRYFNWQEKAQTILKQQIQNRALANLKNNADCTIDPVKAAILLESVKKKRKEFIRTVKHEGDSPTKYSVLRIISRRPDFAEVFSDGRVENETEITGLTE